MKQAVVLGVFIVIIGAGLCRIAASQASGGSSTGTTGTQPPAAQSPIPAPVPSSIIPDNPVLPLPKPVVTKPAKTHGKPLPPGSPVFPVTIQYRPWKGLIALDGLANGNNPERFILSSGLNMSTVSPDDAIRLQLTTSPARAHVAVLDASTDVPTASILNLRLGSGILHNIAMAQVNLITLLTHESMPDAPGGWLGTNWLSDYLVTLDFANHTVTLNRKDAPFSKPTGYIVPFKLKNGRPVVKVSIPGGGSYEAAVDTGSLGTLIPMEIAIKMKSKKSNKTPKTGVDIAGGKMARMVVPRIAVGKAELKNLMVAYYGDAAPTSVDKTMGVIGVDFLRRFKVTISYAKSQIELLAPQSLESQGAPPSPLVRKPGQMGGPALPGTIPTTANPTGTNPTGTIPH